MPLGEEKAHTYVKGCSQQLTFVSTIAAMKRFALFCWLLSVAFCFALAQGVTSPVTLVVHVDGGKKNPIAVSKSDLVVFDNEVKVSSVLEVAPAVSRDAVFAVVVDASGSNLDKVGFIRQSAVDIFDAAMTSPGSRGLLFSFADNVEGGSAWVSHTDV